MSEHIQLYHFERCPYCEKARRAFRALGVDYQSQLIDPDDRTEVIEISGSRSVPMIVHGDTVMNESTDIVEYLDNHFSPDVHLIPENQSQRGHVYIFDKFAEKVWGSLTSYAMKEVSRDGDKLDEAGKASLQDKINSEAAYLDDFFHERQFVAGESLSLGDLSISAFLSRLQEFSNFEIAPEYSHLWTWFERIEEHLSEPV
jgi:glutathione S-transferase